MKRAVLIGGSAVALVMGPLSVVSLSAAAPAFACPYGTVASHFDGVCVSGQSSNGPQSVNPQTSAGHGAQITQMPGAGGMQSVNGIPCTPQHMGTCIGMIQSNQ